MDDRCTEATAAERSRGRGREGGGGTESRPWDALAPLANVDVRARDLAREPSPPPHVSHPERSTHATSSRAVGCVKSKRSDSAAHNANSTDKVGGKAKGSRGEKAYLVHSEMGSPESSPQVNPVLLEYAQRLSEEIVARAVQQWVEVDRRYIDIPYIECDVP